MLLTRWSQKFYESTRGRRIVALLRRATLTVDQIAGTLGLTGNAVRAHLATLERDGVVEMRQGSGTFIATLSPEARDHTVGTPK